MAHWETLASAGRIALAWRSAKVAVFRARRLVAWAARPEDFPAATLAPAGAGGVRQYSRSIEVARPGRDPILERGKWTNLAIAAPHFDGVGLSPDRPLSFWRTLGRPTAERGF